MSGAETAMASALLGSSAISAGGSLAAGFLGGRKSKTKQLSTMSRSQKVLNGLLYDFFMGIKRDNQGKMVSMNPLITQMANRPTPTLRHAGLTDRQKGLLGKADTLMAGIGTNRPNANYLGQLQRGIVPGDPRFQEQSPLYMAAGGTTDKPFIAGEAGAELIIPSGPTVVVPNPKTATPAGKGQAKAAAAQMKKKTGIPGKALGTTPYARQWEDYYLPAAAPTFREGWTDLPQGLRSAYESYLGEQAQNADWMKQNKWYSDYLDPKYGGGKLENIKDWANTAITSEGKTKLTGLKKNRGGQIYGGYYDTLGDWWDSLPQVQGNPQVTSAINAIPEAERAGFVNWLETGAGRTQYNPWVSNSLWGSGQQTFGMRGGQWDVSNPYAIDVGTMNKGVEAYLTRQGYQYTKPQEGATPGQAGIAGGWAKPAAAAPFDYGALATQVPADKRQAFNDFLKTYQGGALSGRGINWNPRTNTYEFGYTKTGTNDWVPAEQSIAPGMQQAVTDFNASQAGTGTGTGTTTPGTGTTTTPATTTNPLQTVLDYQTALASQEFNPQRYEQEFQTGVYKPALAAFEQYGRPDIRESFAGGEMFGSSRQKAEQKAVKDLTDTLAAEQSKYVANARDSFYTRQNNATTQAMNLAKLPTEIASGQADIEIKRATLANIFQGMELDEATTNANLTYMDVLIMSSLESLYGSEQTANNQEFMDAYIAAMTGPGGVNWAQIIDIYNQYNNQSMIAYTNS